MRFTEFVPRAELLRSSRANIAMFYRKSGVSFNQYPFSILHILMLIGCDVD